MRADLRRSVLTVVKKHSQRFKHESEVRVGYKRSPCVINQAEKLLLQGQRKGAPVARMVSRPGTWDNALRSVRTSPTESSNMSHPSFSKNCTEETAAPRRGAQVREEGRKRESALRRIFHMSRRGRAAVGDRS